MEIILTLIILFIFGFMFYFWQSEENTISEKYIVKYQDGEISILMSYKDAASYANIFKGRIIKLKEN